MKNVAAAAAAFTVTLAVGVIGTGGLGASVMLAETICDPEVVSESVPEVRPAPSVAAAGCVMFALVPVLESTTVAPEMGLPNASFAVTVIVEAVDAPGTHPVLHAVIGVGDGLIVDLLAETPPGWTVKLLDVPLVTPVAEAVSV